MVEKIFPSLHLLLPQFGQQRITLPQFNYVPPAEGRKLPNTTLLVQDPTRQDIIWKLTPWEKAESLTPELAIYAHLLAQEASKQDFVHLLGVSGNANYFARAYEYAPYGDLRTFLRQRMEQPLKGETLYYILRQIADAMAYLHECDIVHRDLKAENILVFSDGQCPQVKINDFDRAVKLPLGAILQEPVGSPFHMAPELLAWQDYDRQVDIYAFGILICEIVLSGARLWPQVATGLPGSLTMEEFVTQVVEQDLRPSWQHEDMFLQQLAIRCLAKAPAARPPFREIVALLKRFLKSGNQLRHKKRDEALADNTTLEQPSYPIKAKTETILSQDIGIAVTQGGKRPTMEDALCHLETTLRGKKLTIFGVFDGFNSSRYSSFAALALNLILAQNLNSMDDCEAALDLSFSQLQAKMMRLESFAKTDEERRAVRGTTATVIVHYAGKIYSAFVGDSPAFLINDRQIKTLIEAHSPTRPDEQARIEAVGGKIARQVKMLDSGEEVPWGPARVFNREGEIGLGLTRALGKVNGSPTLSLPPTPPPEIISHIPQIFAFNLTDGDKTSGHNFLILCSDGVTNLLSPEQIKACCLAAPNCQAAANRIITQVEELGAPDNASIIIAKTLNDY